MPELMNREWREKQIASAMRAVFARQRRRITLSRIDEADWANFSRNTESAIHEHLRKAYLWAAKTRLAAEAEGQDAEKLANARKKIRQQAETYARLRAADLSDILAENSLRSLEKKQESLVRRAAEHNWGQRRIEEEQKHIIDVELSSHRARRIASTEVTRANSHGEREGQRHAEKLTGKKRDRVWVTQFDELVCPICRPLHQRRADVWRHRFPHGPPAHPQCLLPGQDISIPGKLIASAQSFYDGPCIELRLNSGRTLSVTPNHSILTNWGWVSAGRITKGTYCFSTKLAQWISSTVNPDNDDVPSVAEEIFSSSFESSAMSPYCVPSASEDFHGDGKFMDGDIYIVIANSELPGGGDFCIGKPAHELLFQWTCWPDFLHLNSITPFLDAAFDSPFSSAVGSLDLFVSLVCGHTIPFADFSLRLGPKMNTPVRQQICEGTPAAISKTREFVNRFASDITADQVVDIRRFSYAGHVYDFQVPEYELFFANGIITHNCRCYVNFVSLAESVEAVA